MTADVVIAGGGTAGHVHPALAVAEELVARGRSADRIHFIGSARGLEVELVPAAGHPLTALPGRGIVREVSLESLKSSAALGIAVGKAVMTLRRLRPQVVVAVGGYASAPAAVAARLLRIPIVVMEQNAVAGAANRLAGRWARVCAVSFEGTDLPNAVHTGNPCRAEMRSVDRARDRIAARSRLGVTTPLMVAAIGGSLGALTINRAVTGAADLLAHRDDLTIRHVIGARDWEVFGDHRVDGDLTYQSVRYEHAMHDVFAAADLVLSRAGATTVAELALTGTPAVLVPLPGAPNDHQTRNARALTDRDGGLLVVDADFDAERVVGLLEELLGDPARLDAMSEAARTQGRPDAVVRIADLIEEHARAR